MEIPPIKAGNLRGETGWDDYDEARLRTLPTESS